MNLALTSPMIVSGTAPRTRPFDQFMALTSRALLTMNRHYEFFLCMTAPVLLTACFYVPLRTIMSDYIGVDYAQYLMPVICLQSVGFVATSAAMRSAMDFDSGVSARLRSLPLPTAVPILSRLAANTVLLVVSLVWAGLSGLVIGWRPTEGVANTIGFFATALVIGILLAFGADVIGVLMKDPKATSQALALPQLILGMLSTGFLAENLFPEWIQPFARNQPVSQFANVLRSFDEGNPTWAIALPATLWAAGILVCAYAGAAFAAVRSHHG
ncbi:UNVERIFIED_CONTAM: ABC-2 type transport system permease protein [Williamsia faeni]